MKLPDTSGFIASPPVLERAYEDPTVLLGLWAPTPHACGLVERRSAYSSHALQPHPTLPVIPQPREEPSFWLTADASFSLLSPSFPLHSLLTNIQKRGFTSQETGHFPRAAGCKHGITSIPVLTTVTRSGDRVEITGMPQLFFRQWSKLSQSGPGRHMQAHMVGSGTWQHLTGPPRGCLQIIAVMVSSRAALSILFTTLLANFLPGFGRDAKWLNHHLPCSKALVTPLMISPDIPSPCS